jgi:hypothetical protein
MALMAFGRGKVKRVSPAVWMTISTSSSHFCSRSPRPNLGRKQSPERTTRGELSRLPFSSTFATCGRRVSGRRVIGSFPCPRMMVYTRRMDSDGSTRRCRSAEPMNPAPPLKYLIKVELLRTKEKERRRVRYEDCSTCENLRYFEGIEGCRGSG